MNLKEKYELFNIKLQNESHDVEIDAILEINLYCYNKHCQNYILKLNT